MHRDSKWTVSDHSPIPQCQSCGRVLEATSDHGTDLSGERVPDYCSSCFRGGAFTEPTVTMAEMVTRRAGRLARELGRSRSEIARDLYAVFSRLDRWRTAVATSTHVGPDTRRLRRLNAIVIEDQRGKLPRLR